MKSQKFVDFLTPSPSVTLKRGAYSQLILKHHKSEYPPPPTGVTSFNNDSPSIYIAVFNFCRVFVGSKTKCQRNLNTSLPYHVSIVDPTNPFSEAKLQKPDPIPAI